MTGGWLIAGHYLLRLKRNPWFVVFLVSVPFLLLLAEFAAFGVTNRPEQVAPVRVAVAPEQSVQPILSCLASQPGKPIELITNGDPAPLTLKFVADSGNRPLLKPVLAARGASRSDSLLATSLLAICENPNQAADRIVIARAKPKLPTGAADKREFVARFFPGLALFGALFISQAVAALVWRDQENGLQRRLQTFPLSSGALIMGPLLFLSLTVATALLIVLLSCAFSLSVGLERILALCSLGLGFSLFAASMQFLVGMLVSSLRTAQAVGASTNTVLAFLGGGFVPLDVYPPLLRKIALVLPNGAAQSGIMHALQNSTAAIAAPSVVVWLWAALLVSAALLIQIRRVRY